VSAALKQLQDAAADAEKTRDESLSRLNSLLDDEQSLRQQLADSAEAHRQRMAEIEQRFVDDGQKVLDQRRDQLSGWAGLAERANIGIGNSVGALTRNVQSQIDAMAEWADALTSARQRGVSENVISMLGLDEGPQALAQLRMFGSATSSEIDALNSAVEARQRQIGDRVEAEAASSLSSVSKQLKAIAEQHAAEVEQAAEEFLAEQRSLNDQLAQLGKDGGRSFGEAIAEGLRSSIPAIREAAKAARRAQQEADAARDAVPKSTVVTGSTNVNVPDGHGGVVTVRADQLGFFGAKPNADGTWTVPTGSVRSFDVGTTRVRGDGLAMVHDGERVVPTDLNRLLPAGMTNDRLVAAARGAAAQPIDYDRLAKAVVAAVGGRGRGVEFTGPIVLNDGVDVEALGRRLEFHLTAGV
jgi:hypothetical protein